MSDEAKIVPETEMVFTANSQRKAAPVIEQAVAGLGRVKLRRLTAGEMLDLPEDSNFNIELVLAAALKQDGNPLFSSRREVRALDWGVFKALAAACNKANSLDLEEAKKN